MMFNINNNQIIISKRLIFTLFMIYPIIQTALFRGLTLKNVTDKIDNLTE